MQTLEDGRTNLPFRQSIRSLPAGQFEQIREMFDHRSKSKCHQTNVRFYTNRSKFENVRELFYLGLTMIEGQPLKDVVFLSMARNSSRSKMISPSF